MKARSIIHRNITSHHMHIFNQEVWMSYLVLKQQVIILVVILYICFIPRMYDLTFRDN